MEGNTVESLLQLQEIDALIGDRQLRLAALRTESETLVAELEGLEKETVALNARLEAAEGELRHAERTVQAGRATLKRLQTRAQEVHNMREHTAARAEVDAPRPNLEIAEDELLDAMQDQETSRAGSRNTVIASRNWMRSTGGWRKRSPSSWIGGATGPFESMSGLAASTTRSRGERRITRWRRSSMACAAIATPRSPSRLSR
jgi:hypothetical protein